MKEIIKYDLYKMVKSRKMYFFYAFAFLVALITPVEKCALYHNEYSVLNLLDEERFFIFIVPIFAVVFCVEDFSSGYIKNIFPSLNKVGYVISKAVCIFLFSVAYMLVSAIGFFITSLAFVYEFKEVPVIISDADLYSWLDIIYKSFAVMEYGMAAVMLTFIFRKTRGIPAFLMVFLYQTNIWSVISDIKNTGLWGWTDILFPASISVNSGIGVAYFFSSNCYGGGANLNHLTFYLMAPINVAVCVIVFFAMVATIVLSERKV